MSRLDLVAGPNGAGKTTLFERVIAPERPGLPFVNADRIARDRFPGDEVCRSPEAARIADAARSALIDARLDFCTETVFSHRSKVDLVATATPACYRAVFYDNASDDGPVEVAAFRSGVADYQPRWPSWTPAPLLTL